MLKMNCRLILSSISLKQPKKKAHNLIYRFYDRLLKKKKLSGVWFTSKMYVMFFFSKPGSLTVWVYLTLSLYVSEIARLPQWLLQSQTLWPLKISTEFYPLRMRCNLSVNSLSVVTCLQTGNFDNSSIRIWVRFSGSMDIFTSHCDCDCKSHCGKRAISLLL